jgi:hypothetical protein
MQAPVRPAGSGIHLRGPLRQQRAHPSQFSATCQRAAEVGEGASSARPSTVFIRTVHRTDTNIKSKWKHERNQQKETNSPFSPASRYLFNFSLVSSWDRAAAGVGGFELRQVRTFKGVFGLLLRGRGLSAVCGRVGTKLTYENLPRGSQENWQTAACCFSSAPHRSPPFLGFLVALNVRSRGARWSPL